MAEHYFIDAYNVMHKSSLLRPVVAENLERAREMLLDKVVCFCLAGSKEVTVVFDGQQAEQSLSVQAVSGHVPGMHIVFSPAKTSADSVIERLIYQQHNRMQCIVVSNDGGLRSLCRGMGALTMEADSFLTSVRQFQQGAREALAKKKDTRSTLLEDHLDPKSMQALEVLRSKLPDRKKKRK